MSKQILVNWSQVRSHFRKCQAQNLQQAIATVDELGLPQITPIGTVFLNDDQTGFYFEMYTTTLPDCAETTKRIAILGVNTSKWYWFKALFKGVFYGPPAVKLYGQLGQRRRATEVEMRRLERRLSSAKRMKGYDLLWKNMAFIREFSIDAYKMIEFGPAMPVRLGAL